MLGELFSNLLVKPLFYYSCQFGSKVDIPERCRLVSEPGWAFALEAYAKKVADLVLFVHARPRNGTHSADNASHGRIGLYCFRRCGGDFLPL